VANAIKYNVRDGAVNVTAESAKDGRVRIAFSDTGIGIPEELKDRVFTPFDRLGTESTGEIEGTGLGLSLSKSLVEVMGGTIDFVSQLDLGSTFYVNMVAAEPLTLSSEVLTELNTIQGETGRMKIVYIEDNSPNIVLMRHVIATMPEWTLYVAETGRRGIELISEKMPDVVLLDLDLPDMGGAEVLRILRADEGLEGLRILVVSADATPSRINSLLASGADEYVSKPFDVKDLVTRIASCAKSGLPKAA
jgi:CheY-like chemotaxis protein